MTKIHIETLKRLVLRVGRGSEVEREVWPLKHTLTSSHLTKLLQKACEDVACLKEFMHEPCAVHGGECFYESKKGSTGEILYLLGGVTEISIESHISFTKQKKLNTNQLLATNVITKQRMKIGGIKWGWCGCWCVVCGGST